jgi:uncharacterized protein YjeT (DUF2065 family)
MVIGMVLIVEGIPWFLSPRQTRLFLLQIQSMTDRQLRSYGLVMMMIGLLVVFISTR